MTDTDDRAGPADTPGKGTRGRRAPRKISPKYLENYARFYLERYASSAENLRRVLYRRVWKSCAHHGTDQAEAEGWVDALVVRFAAAGLVDDTLYAQGRARSLARRGVPPGVIRRRLQAKGVDPAAIDGALTMLVEEMPDPELAAAVAYARRRRFGPWRKQRIGATETRADRREKDLAAMARAGFSLDVARRVIDAEDEAAAEAVLVYRGSE